MKTNIDIDKLGVQIKNMRKTEKGDLLLVVHGGEAKSRSLKNDIEENLNEVAVTARGTDKTLFISDLSADVTEKEVLAVLNKAVGRAESDEETIQIKAPRDNKDGKLTATVSATKESAAVLLKKGIVKVSWVNCRIREKVDVVRCFRCLEFGHKKAECKVEDRSEERLKCGKKGHRSKIVQR
nr:unnamed protein product [Callosobruchus analis]